MLYYRIILFLLEERPYPWGKLPSLKLSGLQGVIVLPDGELVFPLIRRGVFNSLLLMRTPPLDCLEKIIGHHESQHHQRDDIAGQVDMLKSGVNYLPSIFIRFKSRHKSQVLQ